MVQGDPDFLAPVLEAVDLLDPVHGAERGGAVGPGLHHGAHPARRQAGEGGVVHSGEADDLAAAVPRALRRQAVVQGWTGLIGGFGARQRACPAQRGEAVLKDHDVVAVGRDLGRTAGRRRIERALVRRWQERAVLALGGDDHPLAQQRIPANCLPRVLGTPGAGRGHRGQAVARIPGERPVQPRTLIEIYDLAPVRQARTVLPDKLATAGLRWFGTHSTHTLPGLRDLVVHGNILDHTGVPRN